MSGVSAGKSEVLGGLIAELVGGCSSPSHAQCHLQAVGAVSISSSWQGSLVEDSKSVYASDTCPALWYVQAFLC